MEFLMIDPAIEAICNRQRPAIGTEAANVCIPPFLRDMTVSYRLRTDVRWTWL